MRSLRRRAIAKALGMTYKTTRSGGYEIRDEYGSSGARWEKPSDETFMAMMRIYKR